MTHQVERFSDHIRITYTDQLFTGKSLEYGLYLLTNEVMSTGINAVICDLTSVEIVDLSDNDMVYIASALTYPFTKNESLFLIDVVTNDTLKNRLKSCHDYLRRLDIDRMAITSDVDAAKNQIK